MVDPNGSFDSAFPLNVQDTVTSSTMDLNTLVDGGIVDVMKITIVNDAANGDLATLSDVKLVVCTTIGT